MMYFTKSNTGLTCCKGCWEKIKMGETQMVVYYTNRGSLKFHPQCFLEWVKEEFTKANKEYGTKTLLKQVFR